MLVSALLLGLVAMAASQTYQVTPCSYRTYEWNYHSGNLSALSQCAGMFSDLFPNDIMHCEGIGSPNTMNIMAALNFLNIEYYQDAQPDPNMTCSRPTGPGGSFVITADTMSTFVLGLWQNEPNQLNQAVVTFCEEYAADPRILRGSA